MAAPPPPPPPPTAITAAAPPALNLHHCLPPKILTPPSPSSSTTATTTTFLSPPPIRLPTKPSPPPRQLLLKTDLIKTSCGHLKMTNLLQKEVVEEEEEEVLSLRFKEKVISLELMGVDTSRAISHNPSLLTADLDSLNSVLSFLRSKGISNRHIPRIIGIAPKILTSTIHHDLAPVFSFLSSDLSVPDRDFPKIINKCPRLLVSSVSEQLKPALAFLHDDMGILNLKSLAYSDPVLLVSNIKSTLMPKVEFLKEGIGLSDEEVRVMVSRFPSLLTFSIENNLKPKLRYYEEQLMMRRRRRPTNQISEVAKEYGEAGGAITKYKVIRWFHDYSFEDLKGFPHYFSFSLEKRIEVRHREMEAAGGARLPLPDMLKSTDQEFKHYLVDAKNKL